MDLAGFLAEICDRQSHHCTLMYFGHISSRLLLEVKLWHFLVCNRGDTTGSAFQIDAFQANFMIKWHSNQNKFIFGILRWGDLEKKLSFPIFMFSWSQFLHIWKTHWVFRLIFASIKTKKNFVASTLQSFSRFWRNQPYYRNKKYLI